MLYTDLPCLHTCQLKHTQCESFKFSLLGPNEDSSQSSEKLLQRGRGKASMSDSVEQEVHTVKRISLQKVFC